MANYTTIEQSKRLVDFGLDPNKADMCWGIDDRTMMYNHIPYLYPWRDYTAKQFYLPCWSVGSLIELLPNKISVEAQNQYGAFQRVVGLHIDNDCVEYNFVDENNKHFHSVCSGSLIDNLIEMTMWLIENGAMATYTKPDKHQDMVDSFAMGIELSKQQKS